MSKKEPEFYFSKEDQIMIEKICGKKDNFSCEGAALEKMMPNTSEGAQEKHLPVIEQNGNSITVKVGSIFHPMSEEHSIQWVHLETEKGCQRIYFNADEEPAATFLLSQGDRPIAAYAFCNLHGFWKTEIP